ncbi:MAG: LysE family translocator [Porticoccaceae bacterium]
MNLFEILTLFALMAALALVPSSSVALVITRSATAGFANGAAVAGGIVLGDLILVSLAILGMTAMSAALGGLFVVLKYAAGLYLIWFGITVLKSGTLKSIAIHPHPAATLSTSFLAGLLITLGDVKALFFYASLFPAFVEPTNLQTADVAIVGALTVITVGGIKLGYAYVAKHLVSRTKDFKLKRTLKVTAGGLMIAVGTRLIAD